MTYISAVIISLVESKNGSPNRPVTRTIYFVPFPAVLYRRNLQRPPYGSLAQQSSQFKACLYCPPG
jgi:hypothetical protein